MTLPYNPADWYWCVGQNAAQVWSSARAEFVLDSDATYQAWKSSGGWTTQIDTQANLIDVLQQAYPAGSPPPPPPTVLSPLQFMARFTPDETSAIHAAALSSAPVLGYLLQLAAATYVDLNDPLTIAGVDALGAAGLLTSERVAAILTP